MSSTLSLFTPVGLTVCVGIHHTQWIYLMWLTVSLRRACWGCFPSTCSPLSASALWPMQGKRNNGPDIRKEVREFSSIPDFVSELVFSAFLVFQGLDLKLWRHSYNLRIVGWKNHQEVIRVHPAACGRIVKTSQGQCFFWRALTWSKDGHSTTSQFQSCTAYRVKYNIQSEFLKLKLVTSSLHPLQFLRILMELSGPKAGNSVAQVSIAVSRKRR